MEPILNIRFTTLACLKNVCICNKVIIQNKYFKTNFKNIYQNFLLTTFFELYKMCVYLHIMICNNVIMRKTTKRIYFIFP